MEQKYVKCIKGDTTSPHCKIGKIYKIESYKNHRLCIKGRDISSINLENPKKWHDSNYSNYEWATEEDYNRQEGIVKIPQYWW